jgi:hypothetical protein
MLVLRTVHHAGARHFAVEMPDGTHGLLPEWMTAPAVANLALVDTPALTLAALQALRATIDASLVASLPSEAVREGAGDVDTQAGAASGSAPAGGVGGGARKAATRCTRRSHRPAESASDDVCRRSSAGEGDR